MNPYYESIRDKDNYPIIAKNGSTIYPLHFHKKREFTYMLEGVCQTAINNQSFTAEAHEILLVPKYSPHSYHTSKDTLRYTMIPPIELEDDILPVFKNVQLPVLLSDKAYNRECILPLFHQLYDIEQLHDSSNVLLALRTKGYLNILYSLLLEYYGNRSVPEDGSSHRELMIDILTYIDEHYSEVLTLELLAKHFGYSNYHFSRLFNSLFGDSLNTCITQTRMQKFMELQKSYPKHNLYQLAERVGFSSPASFCRAFKHIYGCTPKEYFK